MTTPAVGGDPAAAPAASAPANTPVDPAAQAPANTEPVQQPAAQAPAQPVKLDGTDTPPVEAPATTTDDTGIITYDPTGDAGLDVALAFIGKLGIGTDHPAMVAAMQGDFGLMEATLATMGDKATGWEQMVALAKQANDRAATAANELATKVRDAVHKVAGGEQQWNDVKAWASANATPDEKAALNAMFNAGPIQARAAATMIVEAYAKAAGTVVKPADPLRNASGGNPTPANGPLSARAYAVEVRTLRAKLGSRMDTSTEYAALRARHAAHRG